MSDNFSISKNLITLGNPFFIHRNPLPMVLPNSLLLPLLSLPTFKYHNESPITTYIHHQEYSLYPCVQIFLSHSNLKESTIHAHKDGSIYLSYM